MFLKSWSFFLLLFLILVILLVFVILTRRYDHIITLRFEHRRKTVR